MNVINGLRLVYYYDFKISEDPNSLTTQLFKMIAFQMVHKLFL